MVILDRADAGKMTVTQIQKAEISVWSPTYSTSLTYVYQGAEKDKDIAEWCKDLKFSGAFQRHEAGILWDTQPGLKSTLNGVALIPKCRVDVTFRNSLTSKSWYWEHEQWKNGEEKTFWLTKAKLDFVPENIDMTVSFPGTSYRHETTLTVSP